MVKRCFEFAIKDLFDAVSGDTDLKKEDLTKTGIPLVTSGLDNFGIAGVTERKARVIPANTITIDMFGNAFFRDHRYKMVTHARVFALIPKFRMNTEIGLYIVSQFSKYNKLFSYNDMCSFKKIREYKIFLPVVESPDPDHEYTVDDIDWQYMQDRITELEQDRITELEAYLIASGLDDYELTDEDREILSLSSKSASYQGGTDEADSKYGQVRFRRFKASSFFEIKKGKRLTKADMIEGDINFIGSSAINNGLTARVGNTEHLHPGNTITVSYNGSVGEVFFQEESFWASDDVNVWYPKFESSRESIEYVMTVIKKCRTKYSYSAKWTLDKMKEEDLLLPVDSNNEINFDYMERYIRAIEKAVIADVVKYKDQMIETTKQVVAHKA